MGYTWWDTHLMGHTWWETHLVGHTWSITLGRSHCKDSESRLPTYLFRYPADPPKGKGGRIVASAGVSSSAHAPRLAVTTAYQQLLLARPRDLQPSPMRRPDSTRMVQGATSFIRGSLSRSIMSFRSLSSHSKQKVEDN